jgi:hypothetical protein
MSSSIHEDIFKTVLMSRKCQSKAIEDNCEDWEKAKTKARTDPRHCLVPSRPARFARGRCLPPLKTLLLEDAPAEASAFVRLLSMPSTTLGIKVAETDDEIRISSNHDLIHEAYMSFAEALPDSAEYCAGSITTRGYLLGTVEFGQTLWSHIQLVDPACFLTFISKKSWANLPCFPCYPEGGIIRDNLEEDLRAITSRLSQCPSDFTHGDRCHAPCAVQQTSYT